MSVTRCPVTGLPTPHQPSGDAVPAMPPSPWWNTADSRPVTDHVRRLPIVAPNPMGPTWRGYLCAHCSAVVATSLAALGAHITASHVSAAGAVRPPQPAPEARS